MYAQSEPTTREPYAPTDVGHVRAGTAGRLEAVATVAVLALGIGLRVWRPDLAQVNFDESNVGSLVASWKVDGAVPLVGTVSSYGFRAGEGWPWFAAIGLLPSDDPYALVAVGIAAGIAGLLACWWVARRWLGPWGGVAAAAYHGTAFWCVLLERGVWQPLFLMAPSAMCVDALLRLGVQRRPWALVVACGWLGLLVSVHYTAVAFVLVVPLAMWFARGVLRPRHIAAAIVVGLGPLLPLLVFEANPAVRLHDVTQLLALSGGTASTDLDTVTSTIQVASTYGAAGLGGHASLDLAAELGRWTTLSYLGPLLAALGLVVGIAQRWRSPVGWLIAAWALAPIIAYLHHGAPVIFHYMFIQFPGLTFGVGALGAWAAARSVFVRGVVAVGLAACAAASVLSVLVLLNALDQLDMSAGYGVPIGISRQAGETARRLTPAGGEVLVGDDPHSAEVLRFAIGYQLPSQSFDDCRQVPYMPDAIYLLTSEQTPGAAVLSGAGAPLLARIPRPGGDAYRIYGPPSAPEMEVQAAPDNPVCADRAVWDDSAA